MQLKHIPMDGPQNFRDLGGFLNRDGAMVAWNRLYRADGLSGLSDRDEAALRARNVRTIVDLRSTSEQKRMPDRVPEGVQYLSCPMMRENFSFTNQSAALSFAQSLKIGYLKMIQESADLVGRAVLAVMDGLDQGAVVFHCTAGKDRTGVLAAILLLLLGVSEADIVADYQVSFTYNANGVNRLAAQVPELRQFLERSGEDSPLHSNPKNIRAVLEVLSADNIGPWLEEAGVSRERQQRFCRAMLER
ncbi:MAG: tyrosine-protein phosphatase [Candidatus Onthomonas sp.]